MHNLKLQLSGKSTESAYDLSSSRMADWMKALLSFFVFVAFTLVGFFHGWLADFNIQWWYYGFFLAILSLFFHATYFGLRGESATKAEGYIGFAILAPVFLYFPALFVALIMITVGLPVTIYFKPSVAIPGAVGGSVIGIAFAIWAYFNLGEKKI